MAVSLDLRLLMPLVGLVVLLDITHIIVTVSYQKMGDQKGVPVVIIDDSAHLMNMMDSDDTYLRHNPKISGDSYDDNATATHAVIVTRIVNDETCYNTDITANAEEEIKLCPIIPPGLGPNSSIPATNDWLKDKLLAGGYYQHRECHALQSIAVIVPYSGIQNSLAKFLHHLHPFLMKQQAEYQIFVIDNGNKSSTMTRGQLFNIGSQEALKHRRWHCLVFHEPNLLPLDSRNLYRCSWYPRQLVTEVHADNNKTYQNKPAFEGVLALTPEQYIKANGFSNHISKRDADYFDFYKRLQWANYTLERNDAEIGQYRVLAEPRAVPLNVSSFTGTEAPLHLLDGLISLVYAVDHVHYRPLFTSIRVSDENSQKNSSRVNFLNELLKEVLWS